MKPRQDKQATFSISSYDHTSVTVDQVCYQSAVAIHSFEGPTPVPFSTFSEINAEWLKESITRHPELRLILIDTGLIQAWLDPNLVSLCHQHRIAIETMTAPAIYRHFSLLTNESFNILGVFTSHAQSSAS